MSRIQRLFNLIQVLRQHRYRITGQELSQKLNVSLRTIYRDISTLQAHGATIEGEAGVGYVLQPGFLLPPLMFSELEIEALVLGARWVMKHADSQLSDAAKDILTKIHTVIPEDLRMNMESSGMLVGPSVLNPSSNRVLEDIRRSIRLERKVTIAYEDLKGRKSNRTIWPFALAFFDQVRILVSWCELREDFRHFRTDHILTFEIHERKYPRRRATLIRDWRRSEDIAE